MFTLTTTIRTVSTYQNRTPARVVGQETKAQEYSSLAGAIRALNDMLPLVLNAVIRNDHLNKIVLQFEPNGLVPLTPAEPT